VIGIQKDGQQTYRKWQRILNRDAISGSGSSTSSFTIAVTEYTCMRANHRAPSMHRRVRGKKRRKEEKKKREEKEGKERKDLVDRRSSPFRDDFIQVIPRTLSEEKEAKRS